MTEATPEADRAARQLLLQAMQLHLNGEAEPLAAELPVVTVGFSTTGALEAAADLALFPLSACCASPLC